MRLLFQVDYLVLTRARLGCLHGEHLVKLDLLLALPTTLEMVLRVVLVLVLLALVPPRRLLDQLLPEHNRVELLDRLSLKLSSRVRFLAG